MSLDQPDQAVGGSWLGGFIGDFIGLSVDTIGTV